MSGSQDDARLIALGADVSDGRPIDWGRVRREASDPATKSLLDNLQRLAGMVEAQRGTSSETPEDDGALQEEGTAHWRHLVLLEPVGAGAFGRVYRAWDTLLDREVALKLLDNTRVAGAEPLGEARHLARVRHPNVVTVYGAEQDATQVGIWMEFIQGQTLASMVREHGPMSAREVAGIGIDLCRALSSLHAAGLLHRDIKAHNVMRERGGRVVLMDFSGVSAVEPGEERASSLSGTPLYMAPEILTGRPASFASDIYSLGVLLFYLLAGRHPIEGADLAEIRSIHAAGGGAHLRDLRPDVPETVVQVMERALAVDPATRYRTAGELEHALAATLVAHVASAPDVRTGRPGAGASRSASIWKAVAIAAILVAAIAGAAATWPRATPGADPLVVRMTIGPPYNTLGWPRVSPDGRLVIFGSIMEGRDVLWVRPLDSVEGRPLPQTTARETPFWSADSKSIAFFGDGKLKTLALTGGAGPQTLADAPNPRGGDWNHDGTILFATTKGLFRVSADGTGLQQVTTLDEGNGEYQHAWPEFLSDGQRYLFVVRSTKPEQSGIYLGTLASPARHRLMPAFSRTVHAPSGQLLFVRDGSLYAQTFRAGDLSVSGDPVLIAPRVKYHGAGDAAFDVSENGVLVYRQIETMPSSRLMIFDRRGREQRAVASPGYYRQPRLSPDGNRIAVERFDQDAINPDIWLYNLVRGTATRFTSSDAPDVRPTWTTDGRRILFSSKRRERFDIYAKTVDSTDPEVLLDSSEGDKLVEHWSPDGRFVTSTIVRSGLWLLPLVKGMKPSLIRASKAADAWHSEFSPDGRWVAYASNEGSTPEVFVEPVPATGARWQVSVQGGTEPHWRQDGREIIYAGTDGWLMSVDVQPDARWHAGAPSPLFRISIPEPLGPTDVSLAPDGQLLVVNTVIGDPTVPPIQVVVNWPSLVDR